MIDSLVVISETTDYETQDYKDAMGDLGRNFLNLTSMLVGEIPLLGDFYSNIVDAISGKYEEALGIINKHVAQLQFTELMCDYYTQNWTADRLVAEIKGKIDKKYLRKVDLEQLEMLLEMEGLMDNKKSDVNHDSFVSYLKQKGQELYDSMSDKEREEYGKAWPYDTTDGSKNNNGNNFNDAGNTPPPKDPLIIDLGRKGIELTSLDDGVHFDLDKNGFAEKTAWIGSEDGFLALDRNANGKIDNGGELFGDQVTLKDGSTSSEGFEALAELDENGDDVIDKNDSEFANLRVWIDANHNGVSETDELKTLEELGITSISLDHANKSETDSSTGTIVSESSTVTFADGSVRDISEHWFKVNSADSEDLNDFAEGVIVSSVDSFGNVMSLNNAIFADKTGALAGLVEQFKESTDYIEKRILVKRILYFITDSTEMSKNSRGGNIDARDLHVIEQFMGRGFEGIDGGTSPNVNAAAILKCVYLDIEEMYFNLLNKETVIGDYLDLILRRWGDDGSYLDTSAFKEKISEMMENGDDVGNIIAGVASWLNQYDDVYNATTFDELKSNFSEYNEIFDRIKNTNVLLGGKSNDMISGTSGVDVICGDDGNDTLLGLSLIHI